MSHYHISFYNFFFFFFLPLIVFTVGLIYKFHFSDANYMPSIAVHICFSFRPIVNHTEIHTNCTQDHLSAFKLNRGAELTVECASAP